MATEGEKLQHVLKNLETQQNNRRLWQENDDAESVAGMINAESVELIDAVQEALVTGDVFTVASELGDVLYLAHRMCQQLGFDPADLIEMKLLRNSVKYSDAVLSDGHNHSEAARLSKEFWRAMGGDERFSHAYLDVLANPNGGQYGEQGEGDIRV